VSLLWVFFRASEFRDALAIFERLLTGSYVALWPVLQTSVVLLCIVLHPIERRAREKLPELRNTLSGVWGAAIEGAALGLVAGLLILFGGIGGEFIYFHF